MWKHGKFPIISSLTEIFSRGAYLIEICSQRPHLLTTTTSAYISVVCMIVTATTKTAGSKQGLWVLARTGNSFHITTSSPFPRTILTSMTMALFRRAFPRTRPQRLPLLPIQSLTRRWPPCQQSTPRKQLQVHLQARLIVMGSPPCKSCLPPP